MGGCLLAQSPAHRADTLPHQLQILRCTWWLYNSLSKFVCRGRYPKCFTPSNSSASCRLRLLRSMIHKSTHPVHVIPRDHSKNLCAFSIVVVRFGGRFPYVRNGSNASCPQLHRPRPLRWRRRGRRAANGSQPGRERGHGTAAWTRRWVVILIGAHSTLTTRFCGLPFFVKSTRGRETGASGATGSSPLTERERGKHPHDYILSSEYRGLHFLQVTEQGSRS